MVKTMHRIKNHNKTKQLSPAERAAFLVELREPLREDCCWHQLRRPRCLKPKEGRVFWIWRVVGVHGLGFLDLEDC